MIIPPCFEAGYKFRVFSMGFDERRGRHEDT
jgi:hypothetical protein